MADACIAECRAGRRRRASSRRGVALVVTLAVVLSIASLAIVFARQMQGDMFASRNAVSAAQAEAIVDGVTRAVVADLWDDLVNGTAPAVDLIDVEGGRLGDGAYWIVRPNFDDDTRWAFGVVGESGKLDLNRATSEQLQALPNMSADLADAMIDWRDGDEDVSEYGAEAPSYLALDPAYLAKNADFESVEELKLIVGMDDLILFGEDTNHNGVLDASENDAELTGVADNRNGVLDRGLYDFVTVFGGTSAAPDGDEPVDLNNAETDEVRDGLVAVLSEARANELAARVPSGRPFGSVLEFYVRLEVTPVEQTQLAGRLTASATDAPGGGNGGGDGANQPNQAAGNAGENGDDASEESVLVDVFFAPAEVFEALPGLEPGDGEAIVSARQSGVTAGSLSWVADALGNEKAFSIGPFLAARSQRFSADIVAISGDGRAFARRRVVVDATEATADVPPRVVYSRDLSSLGWPLDPQIMADLRAGVPADDVVRSYTTTGVNP